MGEYGAHKAKQQRIGYEEAMLDIVRAVAQTGDVYSALVWIKDNTKPDDEAHKLAVAKLDLERPFI